MPDVKESMQENLRTPECMLAATLWPRHLQQMVLQFIKVTCTDEKDWSEVRLAYRQDSCGRSAESQSVFSLRAECGFLSRIIFIQAHFAAKFLILGTDFGFCPGSDHRKIHISQAKFLLNPGENLGNSPFLAKFPAYPQEKEFQHQK